jgi:osmotically-inducible protein OsmY
VTGEVEYPYQKQLVADRVAELDGVSGISNNITLHAAPADVHARDVVRQIMRALHRHVSIEASNIHVSVANGNVTLEGTIPTYPERELVEEAVWAAGGVRTIEDHLRVG